LHLSIIAQPRIDKAKKDSKNERRTEITNSLQEDRATINEGDPMIINKEDEEMVEEMGKEGIKATSLLRNKEKHINLINKETNYKIKEDLNNTLPNISIAQLLDISPKVREELVKQLKFSKNEPSVNLVHHGKITISKCKIYDVPSKVYLDYGAGLNLISKSYLEKLPMKPKPVGISTSSIVQVLSDVGETPWLIYKFPLTIGNITIEAEIRLVEKDDLLFDIIICFETIIENNLFMNHVESTLNWKQPRLRNYLKKLRKNIIYGMLSNSLMN